MINKSSLNDVITEKDKFIKNIDLRQKQELLDLQNQLENNQISVDDLSIYEVMDLLDLYNEQLPQNKIKNI